MVKIGQNGSFRVWTELFRVMRAPCHRPMTPNSKMSLKNEKNWFWSKLGQQPWLTIYGQNRSNWVISSLNRAFWAHESSLPSSDDAEFENVIEKRKKLILVKIRSTTMVDHLWSKQVKMGHFEFEPSVLGSRELLVMQKLLKSWKITHLKSRNVYH
jgi:hypothetical protein